VPKNLLARVFILASIDSGCRTEDWKLVEIVLYLELMEFLSPLDYKYLGEIFGVIIKLNCYLILFY
jgi:hypothetical protein